MIIKFCNPINEFNFYCVNMHDKMSYVNNYKGTPLF